MLLGFALAALVRGFVPVTAVVKLLGKPGIASVFRAAAIGVPLPLCSCAVVPVGAALKRAGASNGAVSSFVIATPETGLDSILTTYALMNWPMAVIRPVAAFVTAFAAGVAENIFGVPQPPTRALKFTAPEELCSEDGCCDREDEEKTHDVKKSPGRRLWEGARYAFGEMFEDMAIYLIVGFVIAGFLAFVIPPTFIAARFASPWLQTVALVAVGAPIYVCATAATPIAAVLMSKGISAGAALAFLLTGPATNAASIAVLARYLGRRAVAVYLLSIIVVAVGAGLLTDVAVRTLNLSLPVKITAAVGERRHALGDAAAVVFLLLCANGIRADIAHRLKRRRTDARR